MRLRHLLRWIPVFTGMTMWWNILPLMTSPSKPGNSRPMLIRRIFVYALLMALLGVGPLPGRVGKAQVKESPILFPGQLLVASPKIRDRRFRKAVIYLVKHDAAGASSLLRNSTMSAKMSSSQASCASGGAAMILSDRRATF